MTCVVHAGYLEEMAKPLLGENRKIYKKKSRPRDCYQRAKEKRHHRVAFLARRRQQEVYLCPLFGTFLTSKYTKALLCWEESGGLYITVEQGASWRRERSGRWWWWRRGGSGEVHGGGEKPKGIPLATSC